MSIDSCRDISTPWREEAWSRGLLLGLQPDPNSGYRATVWFEYTRHLFNEIREGSLIAVRNFSDRRRNSDGSPAEDRTANYEEYSILQIDQVHPWHYAIQGSGEQDYPGFTAAAAKSARTDWTDMDEENRDDVSRIKCEAIPLRLAFRTEQNSGNLPEAFFDRSMPMPGFEARLLSSEMTETVLNMGIDRKGSFELGRHIVQYDAPIQIQRGELVRLHFGIFGYTGTGKSNLVSTLVDNLLTGDKMPLSEGHRAFKVVLVDLMDEYTGLLIDHLCRHKYSQLVVCGRKALPERIYNACIAAAQASEQEGSEDAQQSTREAAEDWSRRLILPSELRQHSAEYIEPLSSLILDGKVAFYESRQQQGLNLDFDLDVGPLDRHMGPQSHAKVESGQNRRTSFLNEIASGIERARDAEGADRDRILEEITGRLNREVEEQLSRTAREAIESFVQRIRTQIGTRGQLPRELAIQPWGMVNLLNYQPPSDNPRANYLPSLTLMIGESGERIAEFVRMLINNCFEDRRTGSILYPTIAFIFDEADVFVGQSGGRNQSEANMVEQATMLARRGRKFGLGIGIATQRARFLDTSIMSQPHTYFISKLPRKSDRDVVAEAFAISDETLEQTFGFTVGQWLVASHDATGLKGIPFPVQLPNANDRVISWLRKRNDGLR